jgi:hypothetical protein
MIKQGTQVSIKDGSYMTTQLSNGCISHSSSLIPVIGHNRDEWTVLLFNIPLPMYLDGEMIERANKYSNNILIQNNSNKELWFCSLINIYIY